MNDKDDENIFKVKKWSAVGVWFWEITVDNCAICRNHIMDICIECQAINNEDLNTSNEDNCPLSWGNCGHAFHLHCISRWLKTRHVCPLDNTQWAFKTG